MVKHHEIVLISHWFGHTFHFMECVLPFFLKRGYMVYHVTDKPQEAERFLRERVDYGNGSIENLGMEAVEPKAPNRRKDTNLCRVEAHWKGVQLALEKLYARLGRRVGIFHTWVDLYSHEYLDRRVIEAAMPAPWCGLYVHPAELRIYKTWKRRFYENAMDLFRRRRMFPCRLRAFDVPNAKRIYFWDESMPSKARGLFNKQCELSVFPESIKGPSLNEIASPLMAEIENFRKSHGLVVSLTGYLDKRKGLLTLMRAALREQTSKWGFILGGQIRWEDFSTNEKKEIQQFIANPPINSLIIARRLEDREFDFVIQKSSAIYLAYENFFHSSNVQVKAAFFGKPMIAGPQHLIAERTRRFDMGWCLPEISTEEVVALLGRIDRAEVQTMQQKARFENFVSQHSPEKLEQVIEEISALLPIN